MRDTILFSHVCRKHLHDHIISLRGDVWGHKTGLIRPLFIEVSIKPGKWTVIYLYVGGINIASFYNSSIGFLELLRRCGIFYFAFYLNIVTVLIVVFLVHQGSCEVLSSLCVCCQCLCTSSQSHFSNLNQTLNWWECLLDGSLLSVCFLVWTETIGHNMLKIVFSVFCLFCNQCWWIFFLYVPF